MSKLRFRAFVGLAALAAACAVAPVGAQTAPPAKVPAAAADAQKAAFLAMPEADRKAVQDALGWLNLYNGVVDGSYGRRTLDAIQAYQTSLKAPADGVVSPQQLVSLKASGAGARAAVGFATFDDPLTGVRIGAPMKLLDKKASQGDVTRLASKDGALELAIAAPKPSDDTLASLFTRFSADAPGRKITYKAMKADAFFVVAGEESGRKFYRRYAQGPLGALRGFVFVYPAARADELDRVALAVANAFDPFPTSPSPAPTPTPVAGVSPPTPVATPAPAGPVLMATALVVAPGQAVTALAEADCSAPTIEGKAVRFQRADASGLALLGGDFAGSPIVPAAAGPTAEGLALSLTPGAAGKASLVASDAVVAGAGGARPSLVASLSATARGAPVVDRSGALVGFVAALKGPPKHAGAVIIAEPHEAIGIEALRALGVAVGEPAAGGAVGSAELARRMRGSVVGVFCGA